MFKYVMADMFVTTVLELSDLGEAYRLIFFIENDPMSVVPASIHRDLSFFSVVNKLDIVVAFRATGRLQSPS